MKWMSCANEDERKQTQIPRQTRAGTVNEVVIAGMEMYPAPISTCHLELFIIAAHQHRLNVEMPSLDHSADRSPTCCRWSSDMRAMGDKAPTSALHTANRCFHDIPKL